MLYVTTRNDQETFLPSHVLKENRGEDGGFFLPFDISPFSQQEILSLKEKSFNQCIADLLNRLLDTALSSWDIDFCIGRFPVRYSSMGHRTLLAECWHNPEWNFEWTVRRLHGLLCKETEQPSDWLRIAARAAVLFGVYGELLRLGISAMDLSVVSGDFSAPMSAWYARQWGLPIGNIVCCCNENHNLWDLVCNGHFRTDGISLPTALPEADTAIPKNLERLIFECGGISEVEHYLECCRRGKSYSPSDAVLPQIRKDLFVSVVSSSRAESAISGIYGTHGHIVDPYTALAYSGLQDYRVKRSATEYALILSERSPLMDGASIANALGISETELRCKI